MLDDAPQRVVALRKRRDRDAGRQLIDEARSVFAHQAGALAEMADRLDERFAAAVELIYGTAGHVAVIGVGKSGLIGQKIASTLSSTGTPAFFVHAAEALHGDLGMVTDRETAILISRSGETDEVVRLLPHLCRREIPMVALVGDLESTLAGKVDVALDVSVEREVCPNNLAPTTSTLAALAMGDALAVALSRRRGFRVADFARCHPGGSLGRNLSSVADAMRGHDLPVVSPSATVGESLITITEGRLGLCLVMNGERLVGLVTDGDLRRSMQRHDNLLTLRVSEIMTLNPVTIDEETPLTEAHQRMQQMKLKALVAVNRKGKVTGVVEVFDKR